MTFAACCRTDFDIVSVDVVMMLLLLMVIRSIIHVVVFLMLFDLLEAFAILVEYLLVVEQFFALFFLLAMIRNRSVAMLCIQVDVQFSGCLDGVLQYFLFAIHVWVCWLLLLLLLLAFVRGYLLYAVLDSICLLVCISRLSIHLFQRVSQSAISLVSILPGLKGSIMVSIGSLECSIRAVYEDLKPGDPRTS